MLPIFVDMFGFSRVICTYHSISIFSFFIFTTDGATSWRSTKNDGRNPAGKREQAKKNWKPENLFHIFNQKFTIARHVKRQRSSFSFETKSEKKNSNRIQWIRRISIISKFTVMWNQSNFIVFFANQQHAFHLVFALAAHSAPHFPSHISDGSRFVCAFWHCGDAKTKRKNRNRRTA